MNKYLFLLLMFLMAHDATAQKQYFTDTSNKWWQNYFKMENGMPRSYTSEYKYTGDTVIKGINYLKSEFGYVREDTVAKIVYCLAKYVSGMPDDTIESVLYDYNMVVGDTDVRIRDNYVVMHVVTKIDTTIIGGKPHRIWEMKSLSNDNASYGYKVIEGIGCLKGPAFTLWPHEFETTHTLICFESKYFNPTTDTTLPFFNGNKACRVSVEDMLIVTNDKVLIVPNPTDATGAIVFPGSLQKGDLIISNTLGQAIYRTDISGKRSLPVRQCMQQPGTYFYHVVDRDKNVDYRGKFIYR